MHTLSHQISRILLAVLQQQQQIKKEATTKKATSINNFQLNIANTFSTFCIEDIKLNKHRFKIVKVSSGWWEVSFYF